MENINIGVLDYCILAVYVCMMLGVGFYFKASAKMADYAVADKKLGLLPTSCRCALGMEARIWSMNLHPPQK